MLVMYVFKPQSTQKLTTTIAQTGPEMNIWRHGISHSCQQEYFSNNTFYSTMPRPRQPVERAAFFGESSTECERAITNLLIARTRLMHRNKYETNYAPDMPHVKITTP